MCERGLHKMEKEKYEKIEAEIVFVSSEDVRMLTLDSKSKGMSKFKWVFEEEE